MKLRTAAHLDEALQAEARERFLPRLKTDLADAIVIVIKEARRCQGPVLGTFVLSSLVWRELRFFNLVIIVM